MDISTAQDFDEDPLSGPEDEAGQLPWHSAVPVISSAAAAIWAVFVLLAVTLIT